MELIDLDYLEKDFLAGTDEVGRGPLAGPVVACCVTLPCDEVAKAREKLHFLKTLGIKDSKKLTKKMRQCILQSLQIDSASLVPGVVYRTCGLEISLGQCSHIEIDQMNILQATLKAMSKAVYACYDDDNNHKIGQWNLLIDGNKALKECPASIQMHTIVKGDSKSILIALASITAKEYRDQVMENYAKLYPGYGLDQNAGYPTELHRLALERLGPTPIHRLSFQGVRQ